MRILLKPLSFRSPALFFFTVSEGRSMEKLALLTFSLFKFLEFLLGLNWFFWIRFVSLRILQNYRVASLIWGCCIDQVKGSGGCFKSGCFDELSIHQFVLLSSLRAVLRDSSIFTELLHDFIRALLCGCASLSSSLFSFLRVSSFKVDLVGLSICSATKGCARFACFSSSRLFFMNLLKSALDCRAIIALRSINHSFRIANKGENWRSSLYASSEYFSLLILL